MYAKTYIFYLLGAVLFADKTDAPWECIAGYIWGSAALGYLYRWLYGVSRRNVKEIARLLVILQVI